MTLILFIRSPAGIDCGYGPDRKLSIFVNFSPSMKTVTDICSDPRSANARGTMPQATRAGQTAGQGPNRGIEAGFALRRQGFSEAIVFTVGGGSIDEYGNLMDWVERTSGAAVTGVARRRVVYGSKYYVRRSSFASIRHVGPSVL